MNGRERRAFREKLPAVFQEANHTRRIISVRTMPPGNSAKQATAKSVAQGCPAKNDIP
jgi:hypothetical protein